MKKILFTFLLLFTCAPIANAQDEEAVASFSAFLDRSEIAAGENFQMKLDLINADPYSAPDTSVIPADIAIKGQTQLSSMQVVNGISSKTTSWVYDLTVEKRGSYSVPAISIQTNRGSISTKPFKIVVGASSSLPQETEKSDIRMSATIDNESPFQDEPVLYRLKILYDSPVDQADITKPKSPDAVIEQISEPKQSKEKVADKEFDSVVVDYAVNPLKSGRIVIEPAVLNGTAVKEVKEERPRTSFDNFFDPFSLLDTGISVVQKKVPFSVATNKIIINVKPPVADVNPWLALYDIKLSSELVDTNYDPSKDKFIKGKVGEPVNVKVAISALGKAGDQLPDIEKYINADYFKIYSDKPQTKTETLAEAETFSASIKGTKTQLITLIPQKAGKIQIPEIRINYWSIKSKKIDYAIIPARDMMVEESANATILSDNKVSDNIAEKTKKSGSVFKSMFGSSKYFAIIFVSLLIVIVLLYNRVSKLKEKLDTINLISEKISDDKNSGSDETNETARKVIDDETQTYRAPKAKLSLGVPFRDTISSAVDLKDLKKKIQELSSLISKDIQSNTPLTVIAQKLSREFHVDKAALLRSLTKLDSAVYFKKEVDLQALKSEIVEIFVEIETLVKEKNAKNGNRLTSLNPR